MTGDWPIDFYSEIGGVPFLAVCAAAAVVGCVWAEQIVWHSATEVLGAVACRGENKKIWDDGMNGTDGMLDLIN